MFLLGRARMVDGRITMFCGGILLVLCRERLDKAHGIFPRSVMQGEAHICASQSHLKKLKLQQTNTSVGICIHNGTKDSV